MSMIGRTVSHYRITDRLGEGGMGVVYKAEDLKLDRFVALKFLPRSVASDDEARKRFIIEAKSASSLDHPNICTIHEIDETPEGETFIVMPCYEGETLGDRMRSGPPAIAEAADVARQVASGLARAHEKGIVHRDVKPGNIFLTHDGQVKIVDFGLAKLAGQTRITQSMTTLGTPHYMSPQQAMGEEVDARSDVFSLGVVLYELLTGQLPFKGDHAAAVAYGIINLDPPPVTEYRKDVPGELQLIVEKALEKDVARRYQSAAEFRDALDSFLAALTAGRRMQPYKPGIRRLLKRASRRKAVAGFIVVGILIGTAAVTMLQHWHVFSPSKAFALAVMDFRDLTATDDPTVSAGLSGLIHVGLVESSPIRVISPEYLYDLRRRLFDTERGPIEEAQALEVARQSGATVLLTGQIGKMGTMSYVTWRLVDVATGKSLAAKRVDGDNQVLVADQIIADALPLLAAEGGVAAPTPPPSVSTLTTNSAEAYKHYVVGSLARAEGSMNDAIRELKAAVALDSTFALAYFELSRAHDLDLEREAAHASAEKAWAQRTHLGIKDRMRLEAWRQCVDNQDTRAMETYQEMLARWPDDRQVLNDLSDLYYFNWYFPEAATVSGKGLSLYPDDVAFANTYGNSLAFTGRSEDALAVARAYVRKHSENPNAWDDLGLRYLEAGYPDSAETAFRKALDTNPAFWRSHAGIAYCDYCRGNVDRAIATLEEILTSYDLSPGNRVSIVTDVSFWPGISMLHAEAGRYGKAMELFDAAWAAFPGPDKARELEGRIQLSLRMGRAADALRCARDLLGRAESDYDKMSAQQYEARALVASDSLDAARRAAARLTALQTQCGRSEPFLILRVATDIAVAGDKPLDAIAHLEEMEKHGVPRGGIKDIERRESLARAYRMAGRNAEAAGVLEDLLKIYGSHALAHYELGGIYENMRRPADAVREYTLFLQQWSDADADLPQTAHARERLAALKTGSRQASEPAPLPIRITLRNDR
jgi:tetratricopeptide (TPR) repeat protein